MDSVRPFKPNGSSADPRLPSPRLKPPVPPNVPIQSFSAFQAQTPKINGASPVRRKPVPSSASPATPTLPPISTGGRVIAVGEEDPDDHQKTSSAQPSSFRVPWLAPAASSSPPLVVRDLDQQVSLILYENCETFLLTSIRQLDSLEVNHLRSAKSQETEVSLLDRPAVRHYRRLTTIDPLR